VKLVQRVVAEAAMLADGTTAGVGELEEAREALIAALTAPAALKGQCTVAQFDHECAPGTCAMRNASGGEHDCERTAPAAGEDVELVAQMIHDAPSYYADDLEKRPWVPRGNSLRQSEARALAQNILSRLRAVPDGWLPMQTLVHQHINDKPLTVDGKIVPATYTSDPVILTNGKRVWVERSVIMGGALSSSADKFTAYPSGDKPTHWMPLPAAPGADAPQPPALDRDGMPDFEAVARAIHRRRQELGYGGNGGWEYEPPEIHTLHIETAKAAIREMKVQK
jgi:hypothetical protein